MFVYQTDPISSLR
jgi:hypothetical protein